MNFMGIGHGEFQELSPGIPLGPAQFRKGHATAASGRATITAGHTMANVTDLLLVRAPLPGEVMLTPACNLADVPVTSPGGVRVPRAVWLDGLHALGFSMKLSGPLESDCAVDYSIRLGPLSAPDPSHSP